MIRIRKGFTFILLLRVFDPSLSLGSSALGASSVLEEGKSEEEDIVFKIPFKRVEQFVLYRSGSFTSRY
jgi:hypothetical protein